MDWPEPFAKKCKMRRTDSAVPARQSWRKVKSDSQDIRFEIVKLRFLQEYSGVFSAILALWRSEVNSNPQYISERSFR
jgi:hypothetical protein